MITVSFFDNSSMTLEVEASDTIEGVKARIQDRNGLSPSQIVLQFHGQTMIDQRNLSDYLVQRDDVLVGRVVIQSPTVALLTPRAKAIKVTWSTPSTFALQPVRGFKASVSPHRSCTAASTARTCTIRGLKPNHLYYVKITALGAEGFHQASSARSPVMTRSISHETGPAVVEPSQLVAGASSILLLSALALRLIFSTKASRS